MFTDAKVSRVLWVEEVADFFIIDLSNHMNDGGVEVEREGGTSI